ncbi:ISL3 family transposase [Demequina pelophila]|uniref:ISL3 family transposase n=1 Tax=Demequina pelophila TaxID=1638984 RepID=UPI0007817C0D|nr:ISL3 family transposase [Demequina pelophila]
MLNATFGAPDLTTFCNLDALGLTVTGQRIDTHRAVLECRVAMIDDVCHECGDRGRSLGTQSRYLAHEPFGCRPTTLLVRVRRYRCEPCDRFWLDDLRAAAEPRAKISRGGLAWALRALVVDHLSISRIAAGLGVAWHTANDAVLTEGHRQLINDPTRFQGVRVLGVDEHVWRHTRYGGNYVTVIIDLTPVRDGVGPARLLDMIPGRSKATFQTWLAERPRCWRERIESIAMDGFSGFKTAAAEELPTATAVMDPFHVVKLAGDALDQCRRRLQQAIHGHRGRAGDPLYMARRILHTGLEYLTDRQWARLEALFDTDDHAEVEVTWGVYQRIITAYRHPDRVAARANFAGLIESLRTGVPAPLVELRRLGRTLSHRAADVLAYFDRPGTSNGPTEAINGRLEHLRGSALGFRNLTHYIARSLLETGGFRPQLQPHL